MPVNEKNVIHKLSVLKIIKKYIIQQKYEIYEG